MRKAMIVWGGWPGHDPDLCASMIRGWLKQEGFDVRIETTTAAFADPAIHDLSLIIPIYTMSKIEKPEALNLCAAVRSGVGLAGHHGGMCDAFRDSVEYQFLCGGQWVAHPGNIIDYKVDLMKPDDPIMQGLKSFEHRSEQYYMHVDPANEVLATTTFTGEHAPWIEDVVMPVVWKKRYGEGRVFYSSLGHRAYELAEPGQRSADWLASQRALIDVVHVDVFDPDALAGALEQLSPAYHGVATVALDHPRVRAAIDDLVVRNVAVVTLVSDAPSSRRMHYVGIDNPAAGRTAATLMGRFLSGRKGTVGVIAGSLSLRDHAERQFGFHQILSSEYHDLTALPALQGRDDSECTRVLTAELLKRHTDLLAIYIADACNPGLAAALEEAGKARDIVWIAHELTQHTRRFLLHGTIDAIINQDPGHEARSAPRILLAHCFAEPIVLDQERIRIDIFLRDNLP